MTSASDNDLTESLMFSMTIFTLPESGFQCIEISMLSEKIYYTTDLTYINIEGVLQRSNRTLLQWLSEEGVKDIIEVFSNRNQHNVKEPYIIVNTRERGSHNGLYLHVLLLRYLMIWIPQATSEKIVKIHAMVTCYQLNYSISRYRDITKHRQIKALLDSTRFSNGECKEVIKNNCELTNELIISERLTYRIYEHLLSVSSTLVNIHSLDDQHAFVMTRIINDLMLDAITLSRDLLVLAIHLMKFLETALNACKKYNIQLSSDCPNEEVSSLPTKDLLNQRQDTMNEVIFKSASLIPKSPRVDINKVLLYFSLLHHA